MSVFIQGDDFQAWLQKTVFKSGINSNMGGLFKKKKLNFFSQIKSFFAKHSNKPGQVPSKIDLPVKAATVQESKPGNGLL